MESDICIISEATYPYVTGGVSTCVQQIVENCPQYTFSILYLGASSRMNHSLKYKIPANVVSINRLWLFEDHPAEDDRSIKFTRRQFEDFIRLTEYFCDHDNLGKNIDIVNFISLIEDIFSEENRGDKLWLKASKTNFLWDLAVWSYKKFGDQLPFIQFFYQFRSRILPILRIFSYDMPKARIYYAVTTGHAGMAGVAAKLQHKRPLVLTEHGIYPRERRHDMWELSWMNMRGKDSYDKSVLIQTRGHWLRYFDRLSLLAYANSDIITTLFARYIDEQVGLGADRAKCTSIANGMSSRLTGIRYQLGPWEGIDSEKEFRVSTICRVTPIKDLKTFINAIIVCRRSHKQVKAFIYGPTSEEPGYADSCVQMIFNAKEEDSIKFMGRQNIDEILRQTDLLVLTSISEGQPMVILEAAFAGIPSVATDVGGCRELLEGDSDEDKLLGVSGLLTEIGQPLMTAEAILKFVNDSKFYQSCAEIAMQRAQKYYDERRTVAEYASLFDRALSW